MGEVAFLTFHIVYTPGTVRSLSLFVWSLLERSQADFLLVSNGCAWIEKAFLRALAQTHDRLDYRDLEVSRPLPHGQVLDRLQRLEPSPYFAFLDSDILATGAFDAQLTVDSGLAAAFSGRPTWVAEAEETLPDDFQLVSGTFQQTEGGLCLGNTYCAVYENARLGEVLESSGTGFSAAAWEELPNAARERLESAGMRRSYFDTGKALNACLAISGAKTIYRNLECIRHLGGMSFDLAPAATGMRLWLREWQYRRNFAKFTSNRRELDHQARQRARHRDVLRAHFRGLLTALYQGETPPNPDPTGNLEIDAAAGTTSAALIEFFTRSPQAMRHWRLLWG